MPLNEIEVNLLQPEHAERPMLATLSGIVIEVKPVQPMNNTLSMLVTLSGIVIVAKPVHPENAEPPLLVRRTADTCYTVRKRNRG